MMDPGDLDLVSAIVEQKLREKDATQDRKAKARADAEDYLRDLGRRDPRPAYAPDPITVVTQQLEIQRLDFFTDTSPQPGGGGDSGGTSLAYPGTDGVYALKWSSSGAVFELVKLDEIEVDDCSSGTTVTRKFLALPAP